MIWSLSFSRNLLSSHGASKVVPGKKQMSHKFTFYTDDAKPCAVTLSNCCELGPNVTYSWFCLNHCHQKRTGPVTALGFQGSLRVPDEYMNFIFTKRKEWMGMKKTIKQQ